MLTNFKIFEKCSVAMYDYRHVIDEIYDHYEQHIKGKDLEESVILKEITSKIDFVDDLEIKFVNEFHGSYGKFDLKLNFDIIDDKLNVSKIIFYYKSRSELEIYQGLYHELNHGYELYSYLKNNKQDDYIKNLKILNNNTDELFNKNKYDPGNMVIYRIIYRLFSTTEFNSFIAGIYGEFIVLKDLGNYEDILPLTISYQEYYTIKNTMGWIDFGLRDEKNILILKNNLIKMGIEKVKDMSSSEFRHWLKRMVKIKLSIIENSFKKVYELSKID